MNAEKKQAREPGWGVIIVVQYLMVCRRRIRRSRTRSRVASCLSWKLTTLCRIAKKRLYGLLTYSNRTEFVPNLLLPNCISDVSMTTAYSAGYFVSSSTHAMSLSTFLILNLMYVHAYEKINSDEFKILFMNQSVAIELFSGKMTTSLLGKKFLDFQDKFQCLVHKNPSLKHVLVNFSPLLLFTLCFFWVKFHETPYTGYNRRNGPDFGRMFLRSYYTDITQNTYIQSWTVTEILAREKSGLLWCLRTVLVSVTSFSPLLELHS